MALFWLSGKGQIWSFRAFICRRTHWGNGLKFCMLVHRGHLQNWLGYGHSLLIFLIWALFWLWSNLGVPAILVMLYGFPRLWCPFDWNWSYFGFLGIIWGTCGSKCRGGSGGIFPTICVEFCLVHWYSLVFCPQVKLTLTSENYANFACTLAKYEKEGEFDPMVSCLADVFTQDTQKHHLFRSKSLTDLYYDWIVFWNTYS